MAAIWLREPGEDNDNTERSLMGGFGVPQGPANEKFLFTESSELPPTRGSHAAIGRVLPQQYRP